MDRCPGKLHRGPQETEKSNHVLGDPCVPRRQSPANSVVAEAPAREGDEEPPYHGPEKHPRSCAALWTSKKARRERQSTCLCGSSAGAQPRISPTSAPPPPFDAVEGEHRDRLPTTSNPTPAHLPSASPSPPQPAEATDDQKRAYWMSSCRIRRQTSPSTMEGSFGREPAAAGRRSKTPGQSSDTA